MGTENLTDLSSLSSNYKKTFFLG